jgi:glycosyltransferase involved in cell wall biosynthesis
MVALRHRRAVTRPRIAYVINSVEGGGAAMPVSAVAGVLREAGAEIAIFALTRRDGRAIAAMEDAGLSVTVRDGGEKDHLAALRWLDRRVAAYDASHLWTSLTRATLLGQLVGRRRRLPVVSWQHAAYLKPANLRLLRALRSLATLWVADSHSVAELTAQRLRVPPDRLMTWPLFAADPDAPQARPWQADEPLQIGSLGRLHPVKGYDVLVAALARLRAEGFAPPVAFAITIAGDGAERERLEAAAREAGVADRLSLAGFVERPRDFLAGLHLYLQPSRSEGLCIAAHEAMQAGLASIVSAVGELPYSIEHDRSGLVVPPADPAALADALGMLIAEPSRLAAMGAAARARILERFSREAFAANGRAVLARLTAG